MLEIHLLCRFAVVEQHFVPARGLQAADPRIHQDQLLTSLLGHKQIVEAAFMRHLWAVLALSLPVAVPFSAPQLPTGATGNHFRAYFSLPRPGAFSRARCGLDTLLCSGSHRSGEAPELGRADATFERWARAVGIEHVKWRIGATQDGPRGAVAVDDIEEGEVLVSVPRSKCFLTHPGDASPLPPTFLAPAMWEGELRDDWNVKLALMLLHEKALGHASAWAPFISALPPNFKTVARNLPDSLLLSLQDDTVTLRVRKSARGKRAGGRVTPAPQIGSAVDEMEWRTLEEMRVGAEMLWGGGAGGLAGVATEAVDQVTWEEMKWRALQDGMASGAPTLQTFQWALDCVQSRAFALDTTQGVKCMCLCPMADIFNHDPDATATLDFDAPSGRFLLRTRRAWSKDEEVRITYGALSNIDLLQYYGFVLDGPNAHDYAYMSLAHLAPVLPRAAIGSEADRLDRLTLLAALSNHSSLGLSQSIDTTRLHIRHDGPTSELMKVARVLSLPRTALAANAGRLDALARRVDTGKPLDLDNEIAAWRLLSRACQDRLQRMPTSIAEDLDLLQGAAATAALDEQDRVCVEYRVAHKRLLLSNVERLESYVEASLRVGAICTMMVPPSQAQLLLTRHHLGAEEAVGEEGEAAPSVGAGCTDPAQLVEMALQEVVGEACVDGDQEVEVEQGEAGETFLNLVEGVLDPAAPLSPVPLQPARPARQEPDATRQGDSGRRVRREYDVDERGSESSHVARLESRALLRRLRKQDPVDPGLMGDREQGRSEGSGEGSRRNQGVPGGMGRAADSLRQIAAAFDAEAESLGEPGESKGGAGLDQLLDAIAASGGVGMSPSSTKEAGGDAPERARKGMRWNEDRGEFEYFF